MKCLYKDMKASAPWFISNFSAILGTVGNSLSHPCNFNDLKKKWMLLPRRSI